MRTMAQIQLNFDRTMHQAAELSSLAAQLNDLASQRMEETLQTVGRSWTGDAAVQYLGKGRELERKLRKSADQLDRIADAMREAARAAYRAEREALRLATIRNR